MEYQETVENSLTNISNQWINTSACDDLNMYVQKSRGKTGDKKYNFCCFCHTKQLKIARHFQNRHKDQEEVQKILSLPTGTAERREIIGMLRKKGNFLFNTKENFNDGELIVSRRPKTSYDRRATDYAACNICKGFFSKQSLRFHVKKCLGLNSKVSKNVLENSRRVMGRLHKVATDIVRRKLFPPLRDDDIVRNIRYDKIVIIYANKMAAKYKQERYFEMIRQRLRLIGRFLLSIKKINKDITDLSSVYDPKYCDDAHRTIDQEAHLNINTGNYEIPTVASSLGTLIKQIGNILLNECIKEHDDSKRKNVKNFLSLFSQETNIHINRTVAESQLQQRRRKSVLLPCMEDIKKFNNFLSAKRSYAYDSLKMRFSFEKWKILLETTLLSLQLFNRKRAGEMERLLIEDYNNRQGIDENTNKDLFNCLSTQQQQIAQKYVRIAIRGKLNRTVPVLLNKVDSSCIDTILKFRQEAHVSSKNPYVFGKPHTSNKFLRSCTLMRKYSKLCGADQPERLRGTQLRKHIATTCLSLNLEDQEVADLASFMGHAEKIHKDIYRQPLSREILRMSKILEAAQGSIDSSENEQEAESPKISVKKKRSSKF